MGSSGGGLNGRLSRLSARDYRAWSRSRPGRSAGCHRRATRIGGYAPRPDLAGCHGGGGEIRTRGGVAATRLFESRTLNRSDTPPGEDFTPTPAIPLESRGRLGFLAGAMPGDFRPVAAAAHAAPLTLPGSRGVLEDPVALRVFADAQPRGIALDQLTGDRLREPGDGAVDGVSLVAVVERDAVGCRNQLIDVMSPQR